MRSCPMHPEVLQEREGRCPKCGMPLEPEQEARQGRAAPQAEHGLEERTWRNYVPLVVIFALLLAGTAALAWKDSAAGDFDPRATMADFMAGFFLVFAGFKLMDLPGFVKGYATYDLLAQRVPAYGYVYPFLELGFGLAMAAGIMAPTLLWAEVVVMGFSGIGVALKLARREKFMCACLGTFLKLPLTYVTLLEDFGMAALAVALLLLG